ncbi:hypothetical protein SOVF_150130 [Spinacia oleracea]|nr:hypothetical protein SOVF_150130 [Spinacia oleracea]
MSWVVRLMGLMTREPMRTAFSIDQFGWLPTEIALGENHL